MKAPEMVRVDAIKHDADRPGPAADVWGLGCLVYELVTSDVLFHHVDWTQFWARVTLDDMVRPATARL